MGEEGRRSVGDISVASTLNDSVDYPAQATLGNTGGRNLSVSAGTVTVNTVKAHDAAVAQART